MVTLAVFVLLLGILSVLLIALCGRHVAALRRAGSLLAFCLLTALALALQPGLEVGQREHLAILLALPHFVLLAARLERRSPGLADLRDALAARLLNLQAGRRAFAVGARCGLAALAHTCRSLDSRCSTSATAAAYLGANP